MGGYNVMFDVGGWIESDQMYILVNCPQGYQLINSSGDGKFSHGLQECKRCLPGQYIVNPNKDSCNECPEGSLNSQLYSSCTYAFVSVALYIFISLIGFISYFPCDVRIRNRATMFLIAMSRRLLSQWVFFYSLCIWKFLGCFRRDIQID